MNYVKDNKISVILIFLSLFLVVISLVTLNISNSMKSSVVERDLNVIYELQIAIDGLKNNNTIENALKLEAYSFKIMNIDSLHGYDNIPMLTGAKLNDLSQKITGAIDQEELIVELISEYEDTLNYLIEFIK